MKKRIMVVEDESIVRMDLSLMLQDAGHDVVAEAGDGERAVELALSLKPDLILMDIKMPNLNGLKASEIISNKINTPILILTAYSQREYIDKAKQANILGYLVKPVNEASLIPAVEIALRQAENANAFREQVESMNQKLNERKIVEKAKGILMQKFNMHEEDAFKKMRKISMNKQVTLENVAKRIIVKYNA
ncbi:ANTAR domain-containing response regulator [Cytobacillus oceanisediminis]|uniref:ANTAR domain-containing response regulator n=1 Tax=Cytobacillus oceanisediminis TaxID=665099 RepID=UPI00203DE56D|nr:response regulator [Cytobacillus oceanisediminis]MCM3402611.1 response regulator [Cytobacillus oceanisediminis]MDK7669386.1 response regulator [Cytobacillus oceanisediminis]